MKKILAVLCLVMFAAGCDEDDSECLGLDFDECYENEQCEAIPYWGETFVACEEDERGFSSNCPFEGCRSLGSDCPTWEELSEDCDQTCSYDSYAIDPASGCRICECE